ncbi:MAG: hypothetical protein V1853_05715 [bacterium]
MKKFLITTATVFLLVLIYTGMVWVDSTITQGYPVTRAPLDLGLSLLAKWEMCGIVQKLHDYREEHGQWPSETQWGVTLGLPRSKREDPWGQHYHIRFTGEGVQLYSYGAHFNFTGLAEKDETIIVTVPLVPS